MRRQPPRSAILRALQLAAGLTLALAVVATLWAALAALGDHAGAAVARGITWGLALAWAANLLALIALTAWAAIEPPPGDESPARPPTPPDA